MSTTPTAAPSRAKRSAPARPIPEAAAETMPILPSSRMVSSPSFAPSVPPPRERFRWVLGRHVLAVVECVECRAVGVTDYMALDLQGRRHLTVGDGEGLLSNEETPHPLYRREPLVHARDRGTDRFGERQTDGLP